MFDFLFKKAADGQPGGGQPGIPAMDQKAIADMMKNPAMQQMMKELQTRLSSADQQELMRLAMSRDFAKVQAFLAEKVPDLAEMAKRAGLPG